MQHIYRRRRKRSRKRQTASKWCWVKLVLLCSWSWLAIMWDQYLDVENVARYCFSYGQLGSFCVVPNMYNCIFDNNDRGWTRVLIVYWTGVHIVESNTQMITYMNHLSIHKLKLNMRTIKLRWGAWFCAILKCQSLEVFYNDRDINGFSLN